MSQVIKAITAKPGDRKRVYDKELSPIFTDVFNVKEDFTKNVGAMGVQTLYRIGCNIGMDAWIDDPGVDGESSIEDALQRTRRAVIEAIFGEFRGQFYRIEKAFYDRDYEQARSLLNQLEVSMFSDK